MSFSIDDGIALVGLACLVTGVYLWLGLPAALILLGLVLIYIAARIDPTAFLRRKPHEPDQTINP